MEAAESLNEELQIRLEDTQMQVKDLNTADQGTMNMMRIVFML